MAEKIISPGVFTKEIDQTFLPAAVGEIGAAIVGPTVKGPALTPMSVNSFDEYEQMFGSTFVSGSNNQEYLTSVAAREYLRNSGQLTVVRIMPSDYAPATASVSTDGSTTDNTYATASLIVSGGDGNNLVGTEFTIGSTDFMCVSGSTEAYGQSATQMFVQCIGGAEQIGINVSNAIASSSVNNLRISASVLGSGGGDTSVRLALSASDKGAYANYSGSTNNSLIQFVGATSGSGAGRIVPQTAGVFSGGSDGTSATAFVLKTIADGATQNSLSSSAKYKALSKSILASGSKDNVRWEISQRNLKRGTFTLLIRRGDDRVNRKQVLETWSNLSIDSTQPNYYEKVIGNQRYTIRDADTSDPYLQLSGSYPNMSKYVYVSSANKVSNNFLDENGNVRVSQSAAAHGFPSVGSGSYDGAFSTGHEGKGASGWGSAGGKGNIAPYGNGGTAGEALFFDKIAADNSQGLRLDGTNPTQGYNQYITALRLLKNQDEYDINLLLLPGVIDSLHSGVIEKAVEIVEDRQDCFLVIDPVAYNVTNLKTVTTQADSRDSNYAAMYWPWVQVRNTLLNKDVWVPPSVVIGGVYAFNDKVSQPWFAPAGLNRGGIETAIQAGRKLTNANRDDLYSENVNPIATFPAQGVCVWGQKTLQKKSSALDRVNVRRLLIRVKKFIASSSRFLVFEQNTPQTRRRFLNIVNPYLEQVQANSGLSAFRVVMDESNNTPDVVDRNILYGQIFIQPTRTAEFIVLDFTIQPTGASFPE